MHKYRVVIPRDVKHAYEIDARNGNTLWRDALKKEMYNVRVAFEILDEGVHAPHGWKQVTGHLVWDVKMDFTRKARWVLDGHKTLDPIRSTYADVVSRESVQIALTYTALNDLDVIQFPPEMDENWVRYGLAKLGQISELPNWQMMLFCAYTTQLLHSTGEVCWNNKDSYFIWFEFVCRNSGQIASRRSWKRSCLGLEYTSKCSRLALLWEPN